MEGNNIEKLKEALQSFFASIPYELYRKNDLDSYEGFYASVIYALFNGSGLTTIKEDAASKGKNRPDSNNRRESIYNRV